MKVTLESTDKLTTLVTPNGAVPCRIWEGTTERGVRCHAYIVRIAVHVNDDASQFERELLEQRAPTSADVAAIPARLII